MESVVNVRVNVSRDLWALVKAKATRDNKKLPDVINEILKDYFEGLREK